jgi:putative chitinase
MNFWRITMSFTFNFSQDKLRQCLPRYRNIQELHNTLVKILPKYDITTPERVAGFLAQCGHESLGFTVLRENLNYSAQGLQNIFRKYFPTEQLAQQYARKPEQIANRVYANRMGNGDEKSGDGWQFRGRGAIQLTGRNNYTAFSRSTNMTLTETVQYLETLDGAIESACWFWSTNRINRFCDQQDIRGMTRAINGGFIGLEDRQKHWNQYLKILRS